MKQLKLTLFLCLALSLSQKTLAQDTYTIHATVIGMTDGELYLYNRPNVVDTIKVKNSKFTQEQTMDEAVKSIYITLKPRSFKPKESISLFVEPKTMELTLNVEDFSKSKLKGSKTQDEKSLLDAKIAKVRTKYKDLLDALTESGKKYRKAKAANASEEELEAIKEEDFVIRGKLEPWYKESDEVVMAFIKSHPKSYVSLWRLRFLLHDMQYEEAKAIYDGFAEAHKNTALGKDIHKSVEELKKGIPGALAGGFNTTDIHGNPLKLEDFKGKYLLIDFWASWCVPCRKGNPHLLSLYEKYHSKGLEILGVSDDDRNHDAWRKAVEKDGISIWHHVLRGHKTDPKTYQKLNPEKDISNGYNISYSTYQNLSRPRWCYRRSLWWRWRHR